MNLSQDEISAMLEGALSGEPAMDEESAGEMPLEEMAAGVGEAEPQETVAISAEEENEIAAMLANVVREEEDQLLPDGSVKYGEYFLPADAVDILGEVGNMCMGAVATTMYTLLDRRVSITTPRVSIHTTREVLEMYQVPFVVVEVEYVEGIEGKNLLLLKETDAALITDLLMGGEGQIEEPVELSELHMSAINEIMNQMIGASATALSKVIAMPVNISPPISNRVDQHMDASNLLDYSAVVVKVSFDMEIEGLLKSQLLQLMPFKLALDMAGRLTTSDAKAVEEPEPEPEPIPNAFPPQPVQENVMPASAPMPMAGRYLGAGAVPDYAYAQPAMPQPGNLVDVRPAQFQSFDQTKTAVMPQKGMELVHDISLQVAVELGRTKKEISEILEFGVGTVLTLEKSAGDPVEILVNGKMIARGEVVVIDENYGVRITEIING